MGGMHILIVDDSKLNRKFMSRLLSTSKAGFEMKEAEDGVEAIETIKKVSHRIEDSPIDVVLMDVIFERDFKLHVDLRYSIEQDASYGRYADHS